MDKFSWLDIYWFIKKKIWISIYLDSIENIDYFNGIDDLKHRRIRFVGDPDQSVCAANWSWGRASEHGNNRLFPINVTPGSTNDIGLKIQYGPILTGRSLRLRCSNVWHYLEREWDKKK